MAAITDANVTDMIRSLLGEPVEKHWTDDEITLYKKFAMVSVQTRYYHLLAPLTQKLATASLSASTAYVSKPDDCEKVIKVEVASTGDMLRYLTPQDMDRFEEYDDGAAATNYLNIWYLEHKNAISEFPETLRTLLIVEAALLGAIKDESIKPQLLGLKKQVEDDITLYMGVTQLQEPAVIDDYELEDRYTYVDPVGWLFREDKIYLYKVRVGE